MSGASANQRSINAALTNETDITYSLTVRDADNTELNDDDNPFELAEENDATTGIVLFKAEAVLDYEEVPTYKITVTLAKDGFADTPLRFEVRLMDLPDIPLLAIARFDASSLAGAPRSANGTTYFQIAEDADLSGANANERSINAALTSETDITYSLTVRDADDTELNGADNPFELNTTGIVLFKADAAIDYEDRHTYKITVTLAKDWLS